MFAQKRSSSDPAETLLGTFGINVIPLPAAGTKDVEKRASCDYASSQVFTLIDGALRDMQGRIGGIDKNHQFVFFDLPAPSDAISTSGWLFYGNMSITSGSSTTFWQCPAGSSSFYDQAQDTECTEVNVQAIACTASNIGSLTFASVAPAATVDLSSSAMQTVYPYSLSTALSPPQPFSASDGITSATSTSLAITAMPPGRVSSTFITSNPAYPSAASPSFTLSTAATSASANAPLAEDAGVPYSTKIGLGVGLGLGWPLLGILILVGWLFVKKKWHQCGLISLDHGSSVSTDREPGLAVHETAGSGVFPR